MGKEPGRVGSAAVKGAGFDLHCTKEEGIYASMATGHGENIIESMASFRACQDFDTKEYLSEIEAIGPHSWALGIVVVSF